MKFVKLIALAFAVLLVTEATASAQTPAAAGSTNISFKEVGIGLVIIGAGLGIGTLAKATVESMARQPELVGQLQLAMIIAAALIEGASFFALIIIGFV